MIIKGEEIVLRWTNSLDSDFNFIATGEKGFDQGQTRLQCSGLSFCLDIPV